MPLAGHNIGHQSAQLDFIGHQSAQLDFEGNKKKDKKEEVKVERKRLSRGKQ
jgi:hypothetical protein